MFRVTFLGHQGWLLETDSAKVLVDPLLVDRFGNGPPHENAAVFPPRTFDWAAMPPIDAIVLSHEHEDHFNVQSLLRVDRSVPIYLSDRSSVAARTMLAELGFTAHPLSPTVALGIGDLEIVPFAQGLDWEHPGEWDTLALFARDRGGDGSFLTTVDIRATQPLFDQLAAAGVRPKLWTWPDNEMSFSWLVAGSPHVAESSDGLARDLDQLVKQTLPREIQPELVVVSGNGYGFHGDLAWLDGALFPRDAARACDALNARDMRDARDARPRFVAPLPGESIVMRHGEVVASAEPSGFLAAHPRETWPRHDAATPAPDAHASFQPATGRRSLDAGERARLAALLRDFARFLYASPLFLALGRRAAPMGGASGGTVALSLLEGDDRRSTLLAYDARACRFVEAVGARQGDFLGGLEIWATDLLAILESRLAAARVLLGRVCAFGASRDGFRGDLVMPLFQYAHPLRDPEGYLEMYRAQAKHFASETVKVRARARS